MSSSSSSQKPGEAKAAEQQKQDSLPQLGALEEDDEFEEFPVAGFTQPISSPRTWINLHHPDWDDSETNLAHLGGSAPGAAKSGGDKLWEDNWDDDDIEDEFSVQLRCVALKMKGASL
jgi:26 proteasome complex subunit DSS1